MEELSMDNILNIEDIDNLFSDNENIDIETQESSPDNEEKNKKTTEEFIDTDTLFNDTSEGVGSEENQEEKEDTASIKETGTSPKTNFYSSIAKALKEDGVFPDLDDETADNIREPEDFAKAIEEQIQLKLEEKQKRIDNALNAGVEDNIIRQYENTLQYLDNLTDDMISEEGENGENLRKQLIYQDLINRGYSKDQAIKKLQKSLDSGNDVDDAKEALEGNKDYFQKGYDKIINDAKLQKEQDEKERKEQAEKLKKSILEDNKVFGDIDIDKATRQKVFDNISKPIYKDKETGELFTAIQKYERDNNTEFLKNVGLLYTLTDGFKNLDKLIGSKVKKEVKKGIRELEHTLNNTARTSDGNLRFVSGVSDDSESFIGKNWDLDLS